MVLAAAALIGCTGTAAAAGKKCNEAAFKKRSDQLWKEQHGAGMYNGKIWEERGGELLYTKGYCIVKKDEFKKELKYIEYHRKNRHCEKASSEEDLEYAIKYYNDHVADFQEHCSHHKL
jgi:hypothetical protein